MPSKPFAEQARAKVRAAQLEHGIRYQGVVIFVSSVVWVVFLILLSNGALS